MVTAVKSSKVNRFRWDGGGYTRQQPCVTCLTIEIVRGAYQRARFYDPLTGRFNRLDPFAGNANDPQSFHKYAYVHGDPIQGIDPTGEFLGGLLLGSTIGTQLRNLKIETDLYAFDAITTILLDNQANQTAYELTTQYFQNEAIGLGVGLAINLSGKYGRFLFSRLGKLVIKSRFSVGAASNFVNLRNVRNFRSGRIQSAGDTCGLECAGKILDEVSPSRSITSLDASFGTTAHEILRNRGGVGLDTKELSNLIENNSDAFAHIERSWTSDNLKDWLNQRNTSLISRVDGNHYVHPLRVFNDEGRTWVRVYDPAQGFYDQHLDSFVTRANNGQIIRVVNSG